MRRQWKCTCIDVVALCLALGLYNFNQVPLLLVSGASVGEGSSSSEEKDSGPSNGKQLLVIMLDGFRWDYYEQHKNELRGFPLFLQEGVQAEWVDPGFPSESYPGWTTISTGVYPENHGILGNFMFDLKLREVFDLRDEESTRKVHWWQDAEPIWTTATRNNKKTFLRFWSRCDVPINEIIPHQCTGYREARGVHAIRDTLNQAVDKLLEDYQLVMVYGEHLDNVGHEHGPYSQELKQAMREVDDVIYDFLDRMTDTGLDDKVNVIIVSDHGMTWIGEGSGTVYVPVGDYVNSNFVYRSLGQGSHIAITPYKNELDKVFEGLKGRRGFDAYKREDIPEEYRYKKHRLVQEILLVAKPHFFLQGLQTAQQIPRSSFQPRIRGGTHGYANMTDMRTIFFAKGPDFKSGIVTPPIQLVDEYQLFAHLLGISAKPNNGTWEKVSGMLVSKAISLHPTHLLILFLVPLVTVY